MKMSDSPKILIISHRHSDIDLLVDHLEHANYQVQIFSEVSDETSHIKPDSVDLILLESSLAPTYAKWIGSGDWTDNGSRIVPLIVLGNGNNPHESAEDEVPFCVDSFSRPFQFDEMIKRIEVHLAINPKRQSLYQKKRQLFDNSSNQSRPATPSSTFSLQIHPSLFKGISHKLKTPLNSIIGFTGMLLNELSGPLNEEQKSHLTIIQNSSLQLLERINNFVDLSRLEAGEIQLTAKHFKINEVVKRAWKANAVLFKKKGIDFIVDGVPKSLEINSDPYRLEQILANLISNAVRFTHEGSVHLSYHLHGNKLEFKISDTGIGISSDRLESLTNAMRPETDSAGIISHGLGLGLTFCYRFIGLMGGKLTIESQEQKGTTVTFWVPITPSIQDQIP